MGDKPQWFKAMKEKEAIRKAQPTIDRIKNEITKKGYIEGLKYKVGNAWYDFNRWRADHVEITHPYEETKKVKYDEFDYDLAGHLIDHNGDFYDRSDSKHG